jgi:hypothetical protein
MTCLAAVWAVLAVAVSAAEVWEQKPFTQWSDKDVEKLTTDSPWAGKASLTHEREGANLGPVPNWKLVISVRSALPIKQALLRKELGSGAAPSAEQESELSKADARYVLAISNIPRTYQRQLVKSAQAAQLRPKGKPAISATDASVFLFDKEGKAVAPEPPAGAKPQASAAVQIVPVSQRGGGGGGFGGGGFGAGFGGQEDRSGITATLILEFPRTAALTASDGEVELWTVIGGYAVKRTFKLKDMVFKGALAF